MSDDVVEIVPSVQIDYERNLVTIEPEVAEPEQIEEVDTEPAYDIPGPLLAIDSIHAAASAIEGIWARLYQLEQANVIHEEGNDAQA